MCSPEGLGPSFILALYAKAIDSFQYKSVFSPIVFEDSEAVAEGLRFVSSAEGTGTELGMLSFPSNADSGLEISAEAGSSTSGRAADAPRPISSSLPVDALDRTTSTTSTGVIVCSGVSLASSVISVSRRFLVLSSERVEPEVFKTETEDDRLFSLNSAGFSKASRASWENRSITLCRWTASRARVISRSTKLGLLTDNLALTLQQPRSTFWNVFQKHLFTAINNQPIERRLFLILRYCFSHFARTSNT